jgi:carboxyl-terminal processing protease
MKKLTLIALLCATLPIVVAAQAQSSATRAGLRQETFDKVWRTVKEKHFDPTLGGLDWDKVRQQYEPRVAAAKSDQEFYVLLQQMVGELHQSHFTIFPPGALVEDDSDEPETGDTGIDIQILDGMAVVTSVKPESAAARAGIRTGYVIKQIEQTAVEQIFERFGKSKESAAITRLRMGRALLARINGRPGTSVRLLYLDEQDRPRTSVVGREPLKGEMSPRFGNFPPQYTEFEARRLASGAGYIRFNIFVTSLSAKIRQAIRGMSDAPGIIIDVRGNPGGVGGMAAGIGGLLETRQISLGTMKLRAGYSNFAIYPQENPYKGKVVILIDGRSASTSELFAAGLQEIGRAKVVGERSAGAALPSVFEKLPMGAVFQYAIGDFKSPKGTLIEGRGVAPDVEVKLTRKELLRSHDPQLEAAIAQIQKP